MMKKSANFFGLYSIFIVFLLCFCFLQTAHAGQIDVSILSQTTGKALTTYEHKGQLWVVGNPNDRYMIKINNSTEGRVLSVVSVDGINVISGKTAAVNQDGYVVSANGTINIDGWRKSDQQVARFYFAPLSDSYAARTDRANNVGIIGVAVFKEYKASAETISTQDGQRKAKIGTGHGERMSSPVVHVDFRRASEHPDQLITVRYDTYQNLQAMGIIPRQKHINIPASPEPFPSDNNGYVADPNK